MAKQLDELKVGDFIPFDAIRAIINESLPCDRASCINSSAAIVSLTEIYGQHNFEARSTNTGIKFRGDGFVFEGAFTPRSNKNLHSFDTVYRTLLKHANTVAQARAISEKAFKEAKAARATDSKATKAAKLAFTAARKPMEREAAIAAARQFIKPYKGGLFIASKRAVGEPMSAADKRRLKKHQEDERERGIIKLRPSKERQLSV